MPITLASLEAAGFSTVLGSEGPRVYAKDCRGPDGRRLYTIAVVETSDDPAGPDFLVGAALKLDGVEFSVNTRFGDDEAADAAEAWFAMLYDRLMCDPIDRG